jgi:hypothetical protein
LRPGHQGEARFQSNLNRQIDAGTSVHVRTLPRRGKWDEKFLQRNRHDAPWAIATPHAMVSLSPLLLFSIETQCDATPRQPSRSSEQGFKTRVAVDLPERQVRYQQKY